jgi:amino acid adenylation domain-containing protein
MSAPARHSRADTLVELIERQAADRPDCVAVVAGTRQATYAEVDAAANRLAHFLGANGIGLEDRVGICLHRGVDLAVALLAVWKAGAAYVPLDPAHPADRTSWVLAETGARLVLTQDSLAELVRPTGSRAVCLDSGDGFAQYPDVAPKVLGSPDNAAYVIYTSGSTGRPKGVVVTQGGIGNRVAWTIRRHALSHADRVLQKTSMSFDAAGWEIFGPLAAGGAVVMAPRGAERDPEALVRAVADHDITILQLVPSVLRLLVEEPALRECRSLRLVFSAGEPLHAELCRRLTDQIGVEVWNTYGPTECAIDVTAGRVDPEQSAGPIPIGRPIDHTRILVLDGSGEPVPIGVPGELHAGGAGVARGYLNRPDLTADRFVPDPYGPPGSRLYRTGDLVRWREDGALEYLGRLDHQVKVNGVRVEPGEIEAALAAHADIRGAVVDAFEDIGVKRLVAYVRTDRPVPPEDLRAFLRRTLPEPMIPAVFVPVEAFPLTTSGKVDRKALPAPDAWARAGGPSYVEPRTSAERVVAGVWAELLGADRVGATDDFFQLGGSSLLVTRLANLLRTRSGVDISVPDLFAALTVEAQALLVERDRSVVPPIVPLNRCGPQPLSYGQRRQWFLERLAPGSPEWVTPVLLRLPGRFTVETVRSGLEALAARHDVLRTRYVTDAGDPRQIIDPVGPVELRVIDADGDDLAVAFGEEFARGFDLERGPVWRALLARTSGAEHVVLLTVHHVACDGWSSVLLDRELRELCAARDEGRPARLADIPVRYVDFAAWQRERLTEDAIEKDLRYWRQALADLTPLELPTDRQRPAQRDHGGAIVRFDIPHHLGPALAELGRAHRTSPFVTLLAAFATLLSRYSGQDDLAVGTPVLGRDRPEVDGVVGFFLNFLVVRCDLAGAPTFAQLLDRVGEQTAAALAHQEIPFDRLVDEFQSARDLSRTPLYQATFSLHDEELAETATHEGDLNTVLDAWRIAKTDLTLFVRRDAAERLTGALEYSTALFEEATVRRIGKHFVALLEAVVADPHAPVAGIDLVDHADRAVLVRPAAAATGTVQRCVHELFSDQVARAPGAVALACDGVELSYGELDARANRLARYLRSLGVGPGGLVGVCLPRGLDLVPALLGVLKSGAGYLPLDPEAPADRLRFITADAGAAVVVTDSVLADRFAVDFDGSLVLLDRDAPAIDRLDPGNLPRTARPDDLIYTIYTSGSTGRPKGVCLDHANVVRLFDTTRRQFSFGTEDVWTLFHSYAFDFSVWELWGALLHGGKLVVVPRDVVRSPAEFAGLLVEHGVTVLNQTPSAFRGLVALARDGDPRLDDLALRVVIFGGEKLETGELRPWVQRFGLDRPQLVNMYGITETTVHTTYHRIEARDVAPGAGSPIGLPLDDLTVTLLDPYGGLVPIGVPGEIHVGGPGVARGYLNRPELTAQRFVPDPFGVPGSRLYRSGDLGRLRVDGTLEFLGRADDQVKIRGYRIELGEIEAVVAAQPGVKEAVVVLREDKPGDKRLVAYIVAGTAAEHADLRTAVAASLPDYMVPAAFVHLDRIPLTVNGKLDRGALPAPDRDAIGAGTDVVAARTPTERRIAEMWGEMFGVEVGVLHNFFGLGGDSLLAVRLASRLQEEFEVDLGVRVIFERPTVAQLAEAIEERIQAEIAALSDSAVLAASHAMGEKQA